MDVFHAQAPRTGAAAFEAIIRIIDRLRHDEVEFGSTMDAVAVKSAHVAG